MDRSLLSMVVSHPWARWGLLLAAVAAAFTITRCVAERDDREDAEHRTQIVVGDTLHAHTLARVRVLEDSVARLDSALQVASVSTDAAVARWREATRGRVAAKSPEFGRNPAELWLNRGYNQKSPDAELRDTQAAQPQEVPNFGTEPVQKSPNYEHGPFDPATVREIVAAGDSMAAACTMLRRTCAAAVAARDSLQARVWELEEIRADQVEHALALQPSRAQRWRGDLRAGAVGAVVGGAVVAWLAWGR